MSNLDTVKTIYKAFGTGDVEAMLAWFDDGIVLEPWETTAVASGVVPYYRQRRGKDGAREFYASMSAVDLLHFEVQGFLEGDDRVCARVSLGIRVKATGVTLQDEELHLWAFGGDGKVVSLQHFGDTAKHIEANAGKE